jgi:hypothetical protein
MEGNHGHPLIGPMGGEARIRALHFSLGAKAANWVDVHDLMIEGRPSIGPGAVIPWMSTIRFQLLLTAAGEWPHTGAQ